MTKLKAKNLRMNKILAQKKLMNTASASKKYVLGNLIKFNINFTVFLT